MCDGAVLLFSGEAGGAVLCDAPDFFEGGGFFWFVYPPGGGFLRLDLLFDPFRAWGGGLLKFVRRLVFP